MGLSDKMCLLGDSFADLDDLRGQVRGRWIVDHKPVVQHLVVGISDVWCRRPRSVLGSPRLRGIRVITERGVKR